MAEHFGAFYLYDWYVDVGATRLCCKDTEVKLEAKVMDVLIFLAQHRGQLVTRETLEREIWGDVVVGYESLSMCIAKLRRALGDDPRHPRYIETIHKKGYRLIGQICLEPPPRPVLPKTTRHPVRWVIALGALIAGIVLVSVYWPIGNDTFKAGVANRTAPPSIVVLPFSSMGIENDGDYFSEGITADITTAIAKQSGLFVISNYSAAGFKISDKDGIKRLAGSLGVRYVLHGTIKRTGGKLRVNVHLVDAASNIYLWSEKYDIEIHDVFDVQDDITANVINNLSIKLTEEEKRRTARRYTSNIDAYDDFLRGRAFYNQQLPDSNLSAREFYQRAIDRDGGFARAYSGLAMTYVAEHRNRWTADSVSQLNKALDLARKGVFLDDELPQAYWVLAYVYLFRREYQEASEAAQRAIDLEPSFADSYITLAVCKLHFNEPEEALHLVRKAMLLNPRYPAAYASQLGQIHFFMGEYEQAVPMFQQAIERNVNLLIPHIFLVVALSKMERSDEAAWEAEHLININPEFSSQDIANLLPIYTADMIEDMQFHLQRFDI